MKSLFRVLVLCAAFAAPALAADERSWRLEEFTTVRLAEREAGAPANAHPARLDAGALRAQLAAVALTERRGSEPLFAPGELDALLPVLASAFAAAGPNDDVLLLSTTRRGERLLSGPQTALTARLFMQGDALQLIVHDARLEFLSAYRRTNIAPKFVYGSRTQAGKAQLASGAAASRRADWLSMPLGPVAAVVAPPGVAKAAPPAALPTASAPAPQAAGDAEERLATLKRLREKNLITEDEYQQKRREILKSL